MAYVIYNKETTRFLTRKIFKTEGAAKAHLTRTAKKAARKVEVSNLYKRFDTPEMKWSEIFEALIAEGCTKREAYNASREVEEFNRDDFAIADSVDFHNNIEKEVTRVNLMSKKEFKERINTPHYCSPASESYWSM